MHIEIFDNGLTKKDIKDVPHRRACRGIVKKDGLYLVVRLKENDIHMFPGGGIEENEAPEAACKREVLEETGIHVAVKQETVRITEYFIDSIWTNIYFICDYKGQGERNLTQEEIDLGLESLWMTELELLDTFTNNMTKHPHGPNVHNREFLGFINSI